MTTSNLPYPSAVPVAQPALGARILRMAAVWAALGAIMGASVGMHSGGMIGSVASMMGGMVELAMLGAIFAVVGGRPEESVLGAVVGLLAGLAVGVMGAPAPLVLVANFGLVVGAIAGATLRPYLRLLAMPVVFLGRFLRRRERPAVSAQPPACPHIGTGPATRQHAAARDTPQILHQGSSGFPGI